MTHGESPGTVAVIGTGVIGASWTALFLAHGWTVAAWDPGAGAESALQAHVAALLPVVAGAQATLDQALCRLRWHDSAEAAVAQAGFVQESGPEQLDLKRELFARLDRAAPRDAIFASSTSTLSASDMQAACATPGRLLVGHPFNPPHLIPLVEVVGGDVTEDWAIDRAMRVYRAVGKRPIRLKREVRGHIANRLQAALWQEALHLIREGVADVCDIDEAITQGPGLRWSCVGPLLGLHLSGGDGGIAALFEKPLWREIEGIWGELGRLAVDRPLAELVHAGIAAELNDGDPARLAQQRDRLLRAVIAAKDQQAG